MGLFFQEELQTEVTAPDGYIHIIQNGNEIILTEHQFDEIWNREKSIKAELNESK